MLVGLPARSGPQLEEVEGLPDFERLWFEHPKAWKQLCLRASQNSWNADCVRNPRSHVLPTFGYDQCDAVYGKVRALRSRQMRAHQRRREARRHVLDSICLTCMADFRSRPRVIQHLEVGAKRCALEPHSGDAVAAADQVDCEHRRRCKLEGRSHLSGPPMSEVEKVADEHVPPCAGTSASGSLFFRLSCVRRGHQRSFARTRQRDARRSHPPRNPQNPTQKTQTSPPPPRNHGNPLTTQKLTDITQKPTDTHSKTHNFTYTFTNQKKTERGT